MSSKKAHPPNDRSREMFAGEGVTTYKVRAGKTRAATSRRMCARCGERGHKLTESSVSARPGEVRGVRPLLTCGKCTAARAELGVDIAASLAKRERELIARSKGEEF